MAWWKRKKDKMQEIPHQVIWRTTLYPVCSEREIQAYAYHVALKSRERSRQLYLLRAKILGEAKEHADKRGTRETFQLSKNISSRLFTHILDAITFEKEIAYIDLMFEVNIAALNGEKIAKLRADLKNAKDHWESGYPYFDPTEETPDKIHESVGDDSYLKALDIRSEYQTFLRSLMNRDLGADEWQRRVKEKDWSLEGSIYLDKLDFVILKDDFNLGYWNDENWLPEWSRFWDSGAKERLWADDGYAPMSWLIHRLKKD